MTAEHPDDPIRGIPPMPEEGVSVSPKKDEAHPGTAFELPEAQTNAADSVGDEPQQFENPENIPDLDAADREHGIYTRFVMGAVSAGADSVDRLMTAVYLSQYEDASGEFMKAPIFTPDYRHGFVPYNTVLREAINNGLDQGVIEQHQDDYELRVPEDVMVDSLNDNEEILMEHGAQLGRLYQVLKETLKYKQGEPELLEKMKTVHEKNKMLAQGVSLEYLALPPSD